MVASGKVFVATYGDNEPRRTYPNDPNQHPKQFPQNYYVAVYGVGAQPAPARTVVNQDRDDVTVLRASTSPLTLDTGQCVAMDTTSLDCTDALAQATQTPPLHRVVLATNRDPATCSLLRVTTAAKEGGLANSVGIGFWSSQATVGNLAAENAGRFTPKGDLKQVGTATLKSGAPATLQDFVGVVNCDSGAGQGASRLFKPYMDFEGADGRLFRNWDLAANHVISPAVTQFDRGADVLAP
jgi:hypothetical protein